jgi:hypothetical protein
MRPSKATSRRSPNWTSASHSKRVAASLARLTAQSATSARSAPRSHNSASARTASSPPMSRQPGSVYGAFAGAVGRGCAAGAVTDPAWKAKPAFYLVATEDHMIPVPAQRMMAERAGAIVRDAAGSHAIYVSKPPPVANIIEAAAA